MSITASKYINNSELKTSYIGLFHYVRPSRGKSDKEVHMYGVLSVASEVEIPGDKIAKFAWDGIVDGFEYSKLDSVNESLKLSLTEATRRIKQLIANDTNIAQHGVDVNFTVFVSNNGGIYIGLLGDSDIYVYKKSRLVDVYDMLSSKRAKTAGIAIEDGDIIFSSTKGFLKENIKKLMNTKSREELIVVLEELGRDVGDDQGLVVLSKDKEEVSTSILPGIKKRIKKEKDENVEPKDSDYIPTSKPTRKILKPLGDDKDLKYFFLLFKQKLSILKEKLSKIYIPLGNSFRKLKIKVGESSKKISTKLKSNVSESFGRKRWYKRISSKVSQSGILKRKEGKFKEFKIDGYKQKGTRLKRFKTLFLVVLCISLVLGGIKFTMNQKEAREISKEANITFVKVERLLKDAQDKISTDRASSELSIFQASEELSKITENLGEKDRKIYEDLKSQVLGVEDALYKRVRVSISIGNAEKYVDTFNAMGPDSKPSDITLYRDRNGNEYLLVADLGLKSVYRVSLYNKAVLKLPDDEGVLVQPSFVYPKASGIYVMDLTNGVVKSEFDGNGFKTFSKLSGLSIQNLGAKDIAEFAVLTENENVYVLDREQKTLLRSTRFETGYGLSSPYLSKDVYSEANDVMADLSVYILTPGENGVHRYVYSSTEAKMVESPISIKGLDTELKNAKYGYTVDNLNKGLYIFDSEDKRILRLEKPIEVGEVKHPNELLLLNQYLYSTDDSSIWSDVKDFVVDFKEENLYMLDGTTIWKIRL